MLCFHRKRCLPSLSWTYCCGHYWSYLKTLPQEFSPLYLDYIMISLRMKPWFLTFLYLEYDHACLFIRGSGWQAAQHLFGQQVEIWSIGVDLDALQIDLWIFASLLVSMDGDVDPWSSKSSKTIQGQACFDIYLNAVSWPYPELTRLSWWLEHKNSPSLPDEINTHQLTTHRRGIQQTKCQMPEWFLFSYAYRSCLLPSSDGLQVSTFRVT